MFIYSKTQKLFDTYISIQNRFSTLENVYDDNSTSNISRDSFVQLREITGLTKKSKQKKKA